MRQALLTNRRRLDEIIAECAGDEVLRQEMLEDPRGVLRRFGISLPDHIEVIAVENTATTVFLTLPHLDLERPSRWESEIRNSPDAAVTPNDSIDERCGCSIEVP